MSWPGEGVPTLAGGGGTYPGWKEGYLPWPGKGVPTLARGGGTYPGWGELATLAGVPSAGVDRQMPLKTVPSPIFRMRAVNITSCRILHVGGNNYLSVHMSLSGED